MKNITTHPEHDKLIEKIQVLENQLAILVKNRDKLLFHTGPKLHTEYMLKVGKIEYAIFEYHCKILHPDLNPDLTVEQHGQYIDAVNAYKNADLTELRIIYLLLEKTTSSRNYYGTSLDKLTDRHKSLLIEIDHLVNEIDIIKKRFPFIYINLITKKSKLNKLINELSGQLSYYCDQYNSLEIKLQQVINDE